MATKRTPRKPGQPKGKPGRPKGPKKKATPVLAILKVNDVYTMLVKGAGRADIIQYAAEKKWDLSDRQIDAYIAEAKAIFREHAAFDREEEYGKARDQLRDLYQRNHRVQDYKAAHAVRKDLSELHDLYPAKTLKTINVNIEREDLEKMTDEDLAALIQKIG